MFARVSTTTLVSTHVFDALFREKMCQSLDTESNMLAHHWPSDVYHILLCGMSSVGVFAPVKDGPTMPTSPAAAEAAVGTVIRPNTTRRATRPALTTRRPAPMSCSQFSSVWARTGSTRTPG